MRRRPSAPGRLHSTDDGVPVVYALWYIQERGALFIGGGENVCQGMIIGENAKDDEPARSKE